VFGKLFGRGKPRRDAFGVETSASLPGVPGTGTTTTVTTTSETVSLGTGDVSGLTQPGGIDPGARSPVAGMDLSGLLATVREAQAKAGGDREAMAKLLRERLGGDASVVVDQQSAARAGWAAMSQQQPDPIALLALLTELRDKGVVTDEQFEEQKRRLLS
jgi:Short C-terminal domain